MSSSDANLLEQKKVFAQLPQDWFGTPNMAAVSLFWNTNMAAVTSCAYILFLRETFYHANFNKTQNQYRVDVFIKAKEDGH